MYLINLCIMNCLSVGNEKKISTFKQKHLNYDIFVYASLMIHLFLIYNAKRTKIGSMLPFHIYTQVRSKSKLI